MSIDNVKEFKSSVDHVLPLANGDVDLIMVTNHIGSNGSLHSPLLEDYIQKHQEWGANQDSCVNGLHEVVVEPSSPQYNLLPEEIHASQSRSTFQQIHLNRSRSNNTPRSEQKLRRYSVRNPIEKKSLVRRAAYSAKTDTWNFLYNLFIGLFMWPKWSWDAMKQNSSLTILAAKQGFCAGLASILCVVKLPKPFTQLSSIALWAVITTDLLYEGNIGLSISKGFNRVLGTLAAGCLGFGLNQFGPELGPVYPYFVVFCVVLGGAIFRFLKGIPPLKDQWGYAFTVATIAFHFFIINAYLDPERWTLPMARFSMILLGFGMSSIVNIAIPPIYAGDTLHKLVAKNFTTAATVFERCVEEYIKDTQLDHVPDILSGRCLDDKIHQSYHEIVMSDSDIDKLLSAVLWEPPHGKFFIGYPWHLYDDIADYLRYTLYDVIALDLCLRANIQAPKQLRDIFSQEMRTIATECATVLRIVGESMKNMKKFASENIMMRAEEAAVALQYKIHVNTELLLGSTTLEPTIDQAVLEQAVLEQSERQDLNTTPSKMAMNNNVKTWQNTFLQRKTSLGPQWDGTLERISALSLVKFASLLIEVVSKMRYVVDCVEDLSEQARFEEGSSDDREPEYC